jgi:hypothetical protein
MATSIGVTLPLLSVSAETELTVTRLRTFLTSALSDAALGVYLTAALEAVDDVLGPATATERHRPVHGDILALAGEAEAITAVVEYDRSTSPVTIAADDYEASDSGRLLYRLATGTNPAYAWRGAVKVTYRRPQDAAAREIAVVSLIQLDLNHTPGLTSEQIGTWQVAYAPTGNYATDRAAILAALMNGQGWVW